jgi:hypothetical protein
MQILKIHILGIVDLGLTLEAARHRIDNTLVHEYPDFSFSYIPASHAKGSSGNRSIPIGGQLLIVSKEWKGHVSPLISERSGTGVFSRAVITTRDTKVILNLIYMPCLYTDGQIPPGSLYSKTGSWMHTCNVTGNPIEYVQGLMEESQATAQTNGHRYLAMGDLNATMLPGTSAINGCFSHWASCHSLTSALHHAHAPLPPPPSTVTQPHPPLTTSFLTMTSSTH